MFQCDMCGECCRNLNRSPIYNDLHDGSGICKHLKNNLCSIYINRPLLCRVDDSYTVFFQEILSYDEYINLNYRYCAELKKGKRDCLCHYHLF